MTDLQGPVCVSVINMKGGVGKTTIASLLSRYASQQALDTLSVDLDPQANLSQALMGAQLYRRFLNDNSPSIVELFQGYRPPTESISSPSPLNVDHIAVNIENDLQIIPSRFDFSDNLVGSVRPDPRVLARVITHEFQDKDFVIIDCAPTESIFTQAAYHASRYVLVPVRPEYFATIGFPLLNESLTEFRRNNPSHQIDVIGVVINNSSYHYSGNEGGPERSRSIDEITTEAKTNGWPIFKNQLPLSRGFPKMMRGDYRYIGDAFMFNYFAGEFFRMLGIGR